MITCFLEFLWLLLQPVLKINRCWACVNQCSFYFLLLFLVLSFLLKCIMKCKVFSGCWLSQERLEQGGKSIPSSSHFDWLIFIYIAAHTPPHVHKCYIVLCFLSTRWRHIPPFRPLFLFFIFFIYFSKRFPISMNEVIIGRKGTYGWPPFWFIHRISARLPFPCSLSTLNHMYVIIYAYLLKYRFLETYILIVIVTRRMTLKLF